MNTLKELWVEQTAAFHFPLQRHRTGLSFLSLPAETRVKIYQHLLPPHARPNDYAGLRRSCKLICEEFDYEASKKVQEEFESFRSFLEKKKITIENGFIDMFATNTLVIIIPASFFRSKPAIPPIMIPFHWSWIRYVYIEVPPKGKTSRRQYDNWRGWTLGMHLLMFGPKGPCGTGRDASNIRLIEIDWNRNLPRIPAIPAVTRSQQWQNKMFFKWTNCLPRWQTWCWEDDMNRIWSVAFEQRKAQCFWQAVAYFFGLALLAVFAVCLIAYIAGKLSVLALHKVATSNVYTTVSTSFSAVTCTITGRMFDWM